MVEELLRKTISEDNYVHVSATPVPKILKALPWLRVVFCNVIQTPQQSSIRDSISHFTRGDFLLPVKVESACVKSLCIVIDAVHALFPFGVIVLDE
jgi:hypothetical protein